jgi:hypothetical protein
VLESIRSGDIGPLRAAYDGKASSSWLYPHLIWAKNRNELDHFGATKKKDSPILVIPPELAGSHDFNCLQLFEFALTLHLFVSGFTHNFTSFFFFCFAFLVIAFLLLPWTRFFSAISSHAAGQGLKVVHGTGRSIYMPFDTFFFISLPSICIFSLAVLSRADVNKEVMMIII